MSQSSESGPNEEIEAHLERLLQGDVPEEVSGRLRGRVESIARAAARTRPRAGRAGRRAPLLRPALVAMGLVAVALVALALRRPALEYWYLRKLESANDAVRAAAAGKLGSLRSARAVPRLIALLHEASRSQIPTRTQRGLTTLTRLTAATRPLTRGAQAAPTSPLRPELEYLRTQDLHYSARALIAIGAPAVPALVASLREDAEGAPGYPIARVLAAIGPPAQEPLIALLPGSEGRLRALAAAALGVRGRVVDHRGEPVSGARVYLYQAGGGTWRIDDENAIAPLPPYQQRRKLPQVPSKLPGLLVTRPVQKTIHGFEDAGEGEESATRSIRTDHEGRFVLHGASAEDNRVLVMSEGLQVWVAPASDLREEVTIELPEPAAAVIQFDPGGPSTVSRFALELVVPQDGLWNTTLGSVTRRSSEDPAAGTAGRVTLQNLTPGVYALKRFKSVDFETSGFGRREFSVRTGLLLFLRPGKTERVDLRPEKGVAVSGELTGLEADSELPVYVQVFESPGSTLVDVTGRPGNGRFELPPLPPGTYRLRAEAHEALRIRSRTRSVTSGQVPGRLRGPAFVGETTLTVGPAAGVPVEVEIALRPAPEAPPGSPAPRASSSLPTSR